MSIELDPTELGFQRPFTHEVIRTLHIRNPNIDPVAFKVKTTAPKQYCVRPNSGRIEAGKDVEVQVLLQAMKEDPPPDFKCRDKFLVQSVAITADKEFGSVPQVWSHYEKNEKGNIHEKKIRVLFLDPGERQSLNGNDPDASFEQSHSPPPYASPIPPEDRPFNPPIGPVSKIESNTQGYHSSEDATRSIRGIDYGTPSQGSDLAGQLADARATINKLKEQLKGQDLHQRKTTAVASNSKERIVSGTTGMGVVTHAPEGIPVQICAALCLGAFFIAWFFF